MQVSIHAPARGATIYGDYVCRDCLVSIHAPARGATRLDVELTICHNVSIHAPARGATGTRVAMPLGGTGFNPRARAGRDALVGGSLGARERFNPRARAGRDGFWSGFPGGGIKFQSTRPRGARRGDRCCPPSGENVSIHAPARGATVCQESPLFSSGYNEHSDDLDSSAGKSCASSGEGSIFLFYYATIEHSPICRKKRRA